MNKVVSVQPLSALKLKLQFSDHSEGVVDLSDLTGQGVFTAWKDPLFFEKVTITEQGALDWGGVVDLCPDALYLRLTGKSPEDFFQNLDPILTHA
jgi:hypothetical protein